MPEVKSISKRCTWYSTDTKCVVSNVGVPQTWFKEKVVIQHHMEPCRVVIVVMVVVAVAEVALVGHGLMRTTTCRKGLEFYRNGWPLSKKTNGQSLLPCHGVKLWLNPRGVPKSLALVPPSIMFGCLAMAHSPGPLQVELQLVHHIHQMHICSFLCCIGACQICTIFLT